MSTAEDGNGSTAKQKFDQAIQKDVQVQPAARENRMENPSNVEKGFSVNHGMTTENVHGINTNIECNVNVQDLIAETGEINADMGPKIMVFGQSNTELIERDDTVMIRNENIEGLPDFPMESSKAETGKEL
nr:hypothetical protein CFP56_14291 [Quercus suber]